MHQPRIPSGNLFKDLIEFDKKPILFRSREFGSDKLRRLSRLERYRVNPADESRRSDHERKLSIHLSRDTRNK